MSCGVIRAVVFTLTAPEAFVASDTAVTVA
jgi:hypothetical protein